MFKLTHQIFLNFYTYLLFSDMNVLSKHDGGQVGQQSSISLLSSFMDLPNETLEHIFEVVNIAQSS